MREQMLLVDKASYSLFGIAIDERIKVGLVLGKSFQPQSYQPNLLEIELEMVTLWGQTMVVCSILPMVPAGSRQKKAKGFQTRNVARYVFIQCFLLEITTPGQQYILAMCLRLSPASPEGCYAHSKTSWHMICPSPICTGRRYWQSALCQITVATISLVVFSRYQC